MESFGSEGGEPDKTLAKWSRWRWFLLRACLAILLLPLITWGGLSLWLISPFGRGWVEGKFEQKTGLACQVKRPWIVPGYRLGLNQVSLGEVATIARIELNPSWKMLLRGKLRVKQIVLTEPVIDLDPTSAKSLAQQLFERSSEGASEAASDEAADELALEANKEEGPPAAEKGPSAASLGESSAHGESKVQQDSPIGQKERAQGKQEASSWLHVVGGKVRLSLPSNRSHLIELTEVNVSLPLNGQASQGSLSIARIQLGDTLIDTSFEMKIPVVGRAWKFAVSSGQLVSAPHAFAVRLLIYRMPGLPWQMMGQGQVDLASAVAAGDSLLPQSVDPTGRGLVQLRLAAAGMAIRAATWRGQLAAAGPNVDFSGRYRNQRVHFSSCALAVQLLGSRLQIIEARTQGDEGAWIMIGELSPQQSWARLRVVLSPSYLGVVERLEHELGQDLQFSPLDTPDRFYQDFDLSMVDGKPVCSVKTTGQSIQLGDVLSSEHIGKESR